MEATHESAAPPARAHAWRDRDDVYVGGNSFFYFSEAQLRSTDFRGPDVFVVTNTTRRERKAWVVWQDNGQVPDVIIELQSFVLFSTFSE